MNYLSFSGFFCFVCVGGVFRRVVVGIKLDDEYKSFLEIELLVVGLVWVLCSLIGGR